MFLRRFIKLGSLTLPSNVFCAPLAGCSDLPFRRMLAKYRPGLMFCEMVKMEPLTRNDPKTFRYLDYEESMRPIGAQLCGSKPELAGQSAKILEDLGFDVIDLNCGCPVDKVTKDGSGSGLLKTPERIGEIISNMVAAVNVPVTLKIRAGWDEEHINAADIVKIAEQAGAKAICVHGRTRAQAYRGPANWDYIRTCKQAAKEILVIGNGDIFTAESAEEIFSHTGCDAILIARGTFGQPWIIEDVYRKLSLEPHLIRSGADFKEAILQHLEHVISYQIERKAVLDMRRIGCWYLKRGIGVRKLREALNRSQTIAEVRELILNYPWEETDFQAPSSPDHDEVIV
jgi:tRNA-dihydrouridine synthase B